MSEILILTAAGRRVIDQHPADRADMVGNARQNLRPPIWIRNRSVDEIEQNSLALRCAARYGDPFYKIRNFKISEVFVEA